MLKDENGDPAPVYSVASGLDYPSCGPEHAFLHDLGRVKYDVVTDDETVDAFFELSRMKVSFLPLKVPTPLPTA